jgi:hypothetical protein
MLVLSAKTYSYKIMTSCKSKRRNSLTFLTLNFKSRKQKFSDGLIHSKVRHIRGTDIRQNCQLIVELDNQSLKFNYCPTSQTPFLEYYIPSN